MSIAASRTTAAFLFTGLTYFMTGSAVVADSQTSEASWQNDAETAAQCLRLPKEHRDFGGLDVGNIADWVGLEKWQFMTNTDYLALGVDESGATYLRQKLQPTYKGSVHVVGKGTLPSSQTYTLTQSFFLEPDFDWGGRHEGGKIGFGLGGGSTPTGGNLFQDGFSARLMWRGNKDGTARLAVYAYSSDRHQNLPYGDDYPLQDFQVPVGEWFTITMEVTSNSSTGAADGRVRVWANDILKLQRENIQWQAAGAQPVIDHLMFATFHGGNSAAWSPDQPVFARFGEVCWLANEYRPAVYDEKGVMIDAGSNLQQALLQE